MIDGRNILSTIVQSTAVELFGGYGVAVAPLLKRGPLPRVAEGTVGTTVSFASTVMTGTLALYLPGILFSLLQVTGNTRSKDTDFARELTNQMMGRVKNRLLIYQIDLRVGIPTAITTVTKAANPRELPENLEFTFRFLRGEIQAILQGRIDYTGFVYSGERVTAREGDVIIF